jgi:outer membrane lipoprotein-sorting protein
MVLSLLFAACFLRAETVQPLAGETQLSSADAEKALSELPAFKNPGPLKAQMVAETEDIMGKSKNQGELLLDPPSRVLRNFTKPKPAVWLLNGNTLQEYLPARKAVLAKDFSNAPRALKLIQCAFTGDVKGLRDVFDIAVFKNAEKDTYRLVLVPLKSDGAKYKRIEAKLNAKELFFYEITYLPESGDKVVEKYTEIQSIPKPGDEAFKLALPDDVTVSTDKVSD